jgi:hypothetical protein
MIKLEANSTVLTALQTAFPKPANSAESALNKYLIALEDTLNEAILRGRGGYDALFNLYSISLQKLANKGPQMGPEKIRIHAWLKKNGYELVKMEEIGSGIRRQNSRVKLTHLIHLTDVDDRLYPKEAFEKIHPKFAGLTPQQIDSDYDIAEVDIASINRYIATIAPQGMEPNKNRLRISFHQARRIAAVASYKNGLFYQKKKPSAFGRTYYEGLSVQNVNKELREVMLGDCWEYDIRSSVVSWKLGFAQKYIDAHMPNNAIDNIFPVCHQYSVDKSILISRIKQDVFKHSHKDEDTKTGLIKEALTALNFGARLSGNSYTDKQGQNHKQAIAGILTNKIECQFLLNCQLVKEFLAEQKKLDSVIMDWVNNTQPELLCLINPKTNKKLSNKSLMSYLYQHAETEMMEIFRSYAHQNKLTVMANIHDAIILKKKLNGSLKKKIEQAMRTATNNPYWFLGEKKLNRYR